MISVHELCLSFGPKVVLDHFSLEFPDVPLLGLTGPSGGGKTTLLRVLAGLEQPSSGTVSGIAPDRTAFLFQEDRLLPWRTAGQNISDVLPRHRRQETSRWLAFAELEGEADTMPSQLSGGWPSHGVPRWTVICCFWMSPLPAWMENAAAGCWNGYGRWAVRLFSSPMNRRYWMPATEH